MPGALVPDPSTKSMCCKMNLIRNLNFDYQSLLTTIPKVCQSMAEVATELIQNDLFFDSLRMISSLIL